ncbi:peptidase S66 [Dactylosporangium sucinum]|uniref:Peptidase S66 n=1 Tax=Dactylosporangium sucinum TaxID=1424081 RepID=A0A917UAG9_9ACTN|nr:peptidase S66 [Dactylosporangium sucinum]
MEPGDVVRLVSPSGPTRPDRVARGIELLEGWGLRVELGRHVFAEHGYLAGRDADRLDDLNAALADPRVRAVICTRGGYGAQRIADAVRWGPPKHLVGFSDITALQLSLWRVARRPAVHGPGAAWFDDRLPDISEMSLKSALMSTGELVAPRVEDGPLVEGPPATGLLLGGNLTMLATTLGTSDMPDLSGAILLLEDVGEAPYRLDRMLTQLIRAGALAGVAGVAVGQFTQCADHRPVTAFEVLQERLGTLGCPVLGGLPIGHGFGQLTVVVGAPATLDTQNGVLLSRLTDGCGTVAGAGLRP